MTLNGEKKIKEKENIEIEEWNYGRTVFGRNSYMAPTLHSKKTAEEKENM